MRKSNFFHKVKNLKPYFRKKIKKIEHYLIFNFSFIRINGSMIFGKLRTKSEKTSTLDYLCLSVTDAVRLRLDSAIIGYDRCHSSPSSYSSPKLIAFDYRRTDTKLNRRLYLHLEYCNSGWIFPTSKLVISTI